VLAQEICLHDISLGDEFVILACDGLWEKLSSQEAVNFVRRKLSDHHDAQRAADELVDKALSRASSDNVTAIVVVFHQA
jgi:serine/threonine protein phosphatase PrpC